MATTADDTALRARVAVAALFFGNAFVFANVVPRFPEIKAGLDLSNAQLGTAIAAMPLGALLVGLLASPLIRRFGSARPAVVTLALMGGNVVLIGVVPGFGALCAVMFVAGSLDAITDIAMNAHGLRVQRRYGRSILNSFHGVWSIGAVLGGLAGAGAAQAGLSLTAHLALTGALTAAAAVVSLPFLLPGAEDTERTAAGDGGAGRAGRGARPVLRVIGFLGLLGLVGAAAASAEDASASWGSLYLRDELGANAFVGGLAFVSLQSAQTVGRLLGDRVVRRLGDRLTARLGGALVTAGMGAALLWPSVPGTVVGFGLVGLGVATVIPAVFHAADELPGLWPGAGITVTAFLLRIGFLLPPPLVGLVADAESIRLGLVAVPLAGLVILLAAGVLEGRAKAADVPEAAAAPR
ncbi:MFS transporter [Streptomyces avicenniae]|uniref:MFS transporter n=1 Tax=Streptomyces avicenniae TaxID=500153 RepID=UPI00069A3F46|nr:MFS transporter [Streptomyces avicenniae]